MGHPSVHMQLFLLLAAIIIISLAQTALPILSYGITPLLSGSYLDITNEYILLAGSGQLRDHLEAAALHPRRQHELGRTN